LNKTIKIECNQNLSTKTNQFSKKRDQKIILKMIFKPKIAKSSKFYGFIGKNSQSNIIE